MPPVHEAGGGHRSCQPRPESRASGTGRGGASKRRTLADIESAAVSGRSRRRVGLVPWPELAPPAGWAGCLGRSLSTLAGEAPAVAILACPPCLLEGRKVTESASSRGLAVCALQLMPIVRRCRSGRLSLLSGLLRGLSLGGVGSAIVPLGCVVALSLLGDPTTSLPYALTFSALAGSLGRAACMHARVVQSAGVPCFPALVSPA